MRGCRPCRRGWPWDPEWSPQPWGSRSQRSWPPRFRPGNVIAVGLALEAVVLAALTQVGATSGTADLIVGFALTAFGIATIGLGTNLVVGSAPPEKMVIAGSVAQIANEFGGMLGIALFGTLGTAVYRSQIHHGMPAGSPAPSAATAGDSLAGATTVAPSLPEPQGNALLTAAREAFTDGMHAVLTVGAVLSPAWRCSSR